MFLFAEDPPPSLGDVQAYFWVVGGILLSTVIPWAVLVLKPPASAQGFDVGKKWFVYISKRYGKQLLASTIIGLLIFAIARSQGAEIKAWYQALLSGYVWDSTLQKFMQNR